MANNHNLAIVPRRRLGSHDLQAHLVDDIETDDLGGPEHEEFRATPDEIFVDVVFVFFDAEVASLDEWKPVSSAFTGSNALYLACIKDGKADLGYELGRSLVCLNIEADEYDVVLERKWRRGGRLQSRSLDGCLIPAINF